MILQNHKYLISIVILILYYIGLKILDDKSKLLHSKILKCDNMVRLPNIMDIEIGVENLFFIETSLKQTLSSREACALESAAKNSELSVYMVRFLPTLDLTDNTTCQIFER